MYLKISVLTGFIIVVVSCFRAAAQDVIVTIKNDSIECKVVEKADMFIYYRTSSTKRGSKEIISRNEVSELLIGINPVDPKAYKQQMVPINNRFRIGVKGGFSLLVATNEFDSDDFDEYYQERNEGYWYMFDLIYMFQESVGAGITAGVSRYSNSVDIRDANSGMTGVLSDDMMVQYYAINFVADLTSNRSQSGLTISGGLGLTHYKNDFELFFPFKVRGFDLGLHLNGAYRLSVAPGVFIPIELGIRGFSVNNVSYNTPSSTPPEMEESIGRLIRENLPVEVFRIELGVGLLITL
jgi:hypothetical protein